MWFILLIEFIPGSKNVAAKTMYTKMQEHIELISLVIKIMVSRVTPILILIPYFLLSSINYFYYGLDNESFYLPWPVKYVCESERKIFWNILELNERRAV